MSQQQLYTTNVTIPLLGAAGTLGGPQSDVIPFLRIPGADYGGGLRIVRWQYATNKAIAVGSAPAVRIVSQTSTNAALATLGANGSAATTAGTAIAGTLSTAWVAGTVGYLACEYTQATYGGTSPVYLHLQVQWHPGRGAT